MQGHIYRLCHRTTDNRPPFGGKQPGNALKVHVAVPQSLAQLPNTWEIEQSFHVFGANHYQESSTWPFQSFSIMYPLLFIVFVLHMLQSVIGIE